MSKRSPRNRNKLGRNDPCFCGSGLKYKKCCLLKGLAPPSPITEVPPEILEKWQEMAKRSKELQSKGIYINLPNTEKFKGQSVMAVGNQIMIDRDEDASFHQLVVKNLQHTLGQEWWEVESAKPAAQQHYIRRCFTEMSTKPIGPDQDLRQEGENMRSFLPNGYMLSVMSLAFDVYLLTHKNSLPKSWLRRLRTRDQYQGVRYEIAVASLFVRMGCDIEFYSDVKTKGRHPEFIATHRETGNKVAVEAKSRHRPGVIHQAGEPDSEKAILGDISSLFENALQKNTDGLPYIVFVDVNAAPGNSLLTAESQWYKDIRKMMEERGANDPAKPEPYNALVVTNYSPHYEGSKVAPTGGSVIVANLYTQHPLADGPQGTFIAKLQQAAGAYGYVPRL